MFPGICLGVLLMVSLEAGSGGHSHGGGGHDHGSHAGHVGHEDHDDHHGHGHGGNSDMFESRVIGMLKNGHKQHKHMLL